MTLLTLKRVTFPAKFTKSVISYTVSWWKLFYTNSSAFWCCKPGPGVDFINIFWTAFVRTDPETSKRHWRLDCLFVLLGSMHIKVVSKDVDEIDPQCQFHQHFTCSFCSRGAQKRKMTVKLSVFLLFQDLRTKKLCVKMLMKSIPGPGPNWFCFVSNSILTRRDWAGVIVGKWVYNYKGKEIKKYLKTKQIHFAIMAINRGRKIRLVVV